MRHDGKRYEFIDTAGIRRKGKTNLVAEKLSVIMARKQSGARRRGASGRGCQRGISAATPPSRDMPHESGRSVIMVMNKWDLALEAAARKAAEEVKRIANEVRRPAARGQRERQAPRQKRAETSEARDAAARAHRSPMLIDGLRSCWCANG